MIFATTQGKAVELTYFVLDLNDRIAIVDYVILELRVALCVFKHLGINSAVKCLGNENANKIC